NVPVSAEERRLVWAFEKRFDDDRLDARVDLDVALDPLDRPSDLVEIYSSYHEGSPAREGPGWIETEIDQTCEPGQYVRGSGLGVELAREKLVAVFHLGENVLEQRQEMLEKERAVRVAPIEPGQKIEIAHPRMEDAHGAHTRRRGAIRAQHQPQAQIASGGRKDESVGDIRRGDRLDRAARDILKGGKRDSGRRDVRVLSAVD